MIDKGVIIEYDFAAIDGATLLYGLAESFLKNLDAIPFDRTIEARYFAGRNYQSAFEEYFPVVKTKKTALKAGRDFDEAVRRAFTAEVAKPASAGFVDFVRNLVSRQVKVMISTRADLETARTGFAGLPGHGISYHQELSTTYGGITWDMWRRRCAQCALHPRAAVAVTGSGLGVKAALRAGLGAVAVTNEHCAYQDYTGCNEFFRSLDASAAGSIFRILKI